MRWIVVVAVTTLLLTLALPAPAQEATGEVVVVHGLRGLVADVYVDGQRVLEGFSPERTTDAIALPAGEHAVEVREAGQPRGSEPLLSGSLDIGSGDHLSAVVHASRGGQPQMTVFSNALTRLPTGRSRLVVRHTADAGPIDVRVDEQRLASDLMPGRETAKRLRRPSHEVVVAAAGQPQPLVPPADVRVNEGTQTTLYLIGSANRDSLGWIAQSFDSVASAPGGVPSGNSGLAATNRMPAQGPVPVAIAGAVALIALLLHKRRLSSTP
ncbi:MAG: DUF4397 domain-containing protein [Actinomycetota bacterium]|nr:DUF4397 domain-containing protein [Actinomycetota bacterium]